VRIGIFIRNEGAIRWERDASRDDSRFRKAKITFVGFDEIGDPKRCGAWEQVVDAREVEIAGPTLGKINIAHGFERHANEQMKMRSLRLDERLDGNVVGDVVSRCAPRKEQERGHQEQAVNSKHNFSLYFVAYFAT